MSASHQLLCNKALHSISRSFPLVPPFSGWSLFNPLPACKCNIQLFTVYKHGIYKVSEGKNGKDQFILGISLLETGCIFFNIMNPDFS